LRKLLKVLVGFAVVCAIIACVVALWPQFTGHTVVGSVTEAVTGSETAGELADAVSSSDTVSDDEIQSTLGLTDSEYEKLKSLAEDAGIDINDSDQLKSLASQAAGHTSELKSIAQQLESGEISESTAASEISSILGTDSGQ
jgi:hypothetical protein